MPDDDGNTKHRHDVLVLEQTVLVSKDVPLLASVAQHGLGVAVSSPVGHGKIGAEISLDVWHQRILQVVFGRHRHEGSEPVHRIFCLIQLKPFKEVGIGPTQLPRLPSGTGRECQVLERFLFLPSSRDRLMD